MRNDSHRIDMVTVIGMAMSSFLFSFADAFVALALPAIHCGDIGEIRPLAMSWGPSETETKCMSHITSIRCRNFAGATGVNGGDLTLDMSSCAIDCETQLSNLVAVTGETGHGKV